MSTNKKLISFVVPVLNEELNIVPFYKEVSSIIELCKENYDFEIIFTDNHSVDSTFQKLSTLAQTDTKIRVIRFARNYGYQKSILAGYLHAKGAAVIQLDCDLQDPPALIIEFLKYWEQGYAVVYGVRKKTADNMAVSFVRKLFYRTIHFLSEDELPLDAGDFRLIDRKIVEVLRQMDDAQPYLRGTIASIGFSQHGIPYNRAERQRGTSNFSFKDMMKLALDGILNHSIVPLRIASFFGISISLLTASLAGVYIIAKFFFRHTWPAGFTTLTILILFGISINSLFLGIIGEYLGRIYQQTKKKPIVIEAKIESTV